MSIPDRSNSELVTEIITLRKRLAETEEENRRLQSGQRIGTEQKLEAVGIMAGRIAHDFNNILASMIGYTELAMDEPDEKERLNNLRQVLRSCDLAKSLVSRILDFSRRSIS